MKFTTTFLIIALILPTTSNAASTLQRLTQAACDELEKVLKITNSATCEGDGKYLGFGKGFIADVACKLTQSPCLNPPDGLCVQGTFGTKLAFGFSGGVKANADLTGCFVFTSGFPGDLTSLGVDTLCITAKPNSQLKLGSCKAEMKSGATSFPCNSCEICDNGVGLNFDCSNVNIAPPEQSSFPGPNPDCLGVSLCDLF